MVDMAHFSMADMARCGTGLRRFGNDAMTMEQTAGRIVRYMYDEFRDPTSGARTFALVRCYKTHAFGALPAPLQDFARTAIADVYPKHETACLTLLGTVGDVDDWNDRRRSRGHQAIPLTSPELVARLPMIAQLISQFGVSVETLLAHDPVELLDMQQRTFNVFFVPDALDSPIVPAQEEFVRPHQIRSVIGFGSLLPSGDLFAVIGFGRVTITRETAELFKPLALNVKLALLAFEANQVFAA